MEYMLKTTLVPRFGGKTSCDEIGLPVSATGGVVPAAQRPFGKNKRGKRARPLSFALLSSHPRKGEPLQNRKVCRTAKVSLGRGGIAQR